MNELIKQLQNRRSVREFTGEKIKEEDLKTILATAQRAANSVNGQQTSLIVVRDKEKLANIDPENEDKLKLAIESLTNNKTVIMIAHRLKTIRNASQILVLNKGCIEQRGTHDELMRQGGIYKDFVDAKSKSENWSLNN